MKRVINRLLVRLAMISVGGAIFSVLGLFDQVTPAGGGCLQAARFFNPCAGAGDVLAPAVCTQSDFNDLLDGFGPNFERDPFCSLPQTCTGTTFDPTAGDGLTGAFDNTPFTQPTNP